MKARHQCGGRLVCRQGICSECAKTDECDHKHRCQATDEGHMACVPRDLIAHWDLWVVLCTILVVVTAVLSAAAGMGGGGVFVPLLLLLMGFNAKEAAPLSQGMIVGGAVVNILMFCGDRHPKNAHKSKIDYEIIMMLNPGLAVGVTIGVICNVISPQWLIVIILLITLVLAFHKSLTKGLDQWKKESKKAEELKARGISQGNDDAKFQLKLVDLGNFFRLAAVHATPLTLIFGCWTTLCVMNVF